MSFWSRRRNKTIITFDDMMKELTGFHNTGANSLKDIIDCFDGMKALIMRLKMDSVELECKKCRKSNDHSRSSDDSKQLEELKNEYKELKKEVDPLKSDLKSSKARIKQLENDLNELKKDKKALQDKITCISKELISFEQEVTEEFDNTQRFGSSRPYHGEGHGTDVDLPILNKLATLRTNQLSWRHDIKEKLENQEKEVDRLREKLQQEGEEHKAELKAKSDEYNQILNNRLDESEDMMSKIRDYETKNKRLSDELQGSQKELKASNKVCEDLDKLIQDKDKELDLRKKKFLEKTEVCKQLQLELTNTERKAEQHLKDVESLQSKLSSIEEKLAKTKEESHIKQEELNNKISDVQKESMDNTKKYKGICRQLDSEKSRSSGLNEQLHRQRHESSTLKQENVLDDMLQKVVDKLKNEIEELRSQIEELQRKSHKFVHVNVHSALKQSLSAQVIGELMSRMTERLKQDDVNLDYQEYSSGYISGPLVVLCINVSRIGTDVKEALKGLSKDIQDVAMLVLHHKETHALPSQSSDRILTGPEYKQLGVIIDLAFLSQRGLYQCDMNTRAIDRLADYLLRHKKDA